MMKKHNFSAGPCILPDSVFQEASKSILNFNESNLSLLEISHRSKGFVDVMDEAEQLVKEILNVPSGYSVVFLQIVHTWQSFEMFNPYIVVYCLNQLPLPLELPFESIRLKNKWVNGYLH